MEVSFSKEFKREYNKIKDKLTRERIIKAIQKVADSPISGKPLRYSFKGHRCLRVPPYRIIYRLEGNRILVNYFDHRGKAYKKSPAS